MSRYLAASFVSMGSQIACATNTVPEIVNKNSFCVEFPSLKTLLSSYYKAAFAAAKHEMSLLGACHWVEGSPCVTKFIVTWVQMALSHLAISQNLIHHAFFKSIQIRNTLCLRACSAGLPGFLELRTFILSQGFEDRRHLHFMSSALIIA